MSLTTQLEVPGLKVKSLALASKPASSGKCPVLDLRTVLFFDLLKMGQGSEQSWFAMKQARELANFLGTFFGRSPEFSGKFATFWAKAFFFFGKHFQVVSVVLDLGLEHFCCCPREGLSSEGMSLASKFVCVLDLGLEPWVLDSTFENHFHLQFRTCRFTWTCFNSP